MIHLEWNFPLWSLVTKALVHKNGATRAVVALKDEPHGYFIPIFSTKELAEAFQTEFFMGKAKTIQLLMINDTESFQEIVQTLEPLGCDYVGFDMQAKQGRPIRGDFWKTKRFLNRTEN